MVPLPAASGPVTAGISLEVNSVAANVGVAGVLGAVGGSSPHPAAKTAIAMKARRFMTVLLVADVGARLSPELAPQVETEVQRAGRATSRELSEGRRERIGERELEHVPADPLFDAERVLWIARFVACEPRRDFRDDIH